MIKGFEMKKNIIANLKMNFTQEECKQYLLELLPLVSNCQNKVGICFPYTDLPLAKDMLFDTKIKIGAQNVHEEESGAYTGEISAKMLKELGCDFVLVGHSERRQYFGETNKQINQKIKLLLKYGIKPVLCIGETKAERENKKTNVILKSQLNGCLAGLYENEIKSIVVAYEPVWAVGTGVQPTAKQVDEVCNLIRETIAQNFSEKASKNICILYGGSLKAENAKQFLSLSNINGGLVGGASLQAESFSKLANFR